MVVKGSIFLRGLRFHCPIGVLEQERKVGNDVSIDVTIDYPLEKALRSDDVDDTLNYAAVFDIIRQEAMKPAKLLERLAGRIAESLVNAYPTIISLTIRITKLNPPMGADSEGAGVEIHLINTKTE